MDQPGIDQRELRRMAREVDEQHHEAMRTLHDELAEAHFGNTDPQVDERRRQFLKGAGLSGAALALGGAATLAAVLPAAAQTTSAEEPSDADVAILQFAEGLELAAAEAYDAALATRRLDVAVNETVRTFGIHHHDHATALATLAGKKATHTTNRLLVQLFTPQIQAATDQQGVLQVLFQLEQGAASTYALALGELEGKAPAAGASSILPVESQHAVVWGQTLKLPIDQWLPNFQSKSDAFDPSRYATS